MGEGHSDLLGVEQEEGGGIKSLSFPAVKSSMISRDIDDRDTDGREYLHVESFFRDCSFVRNTNLKEGALSTIDLYGRVNLEGRDSRGDHTVIILISLCRAHWKVENYVFGLVRCRHGISIGYACMDVIICYITV